jgi:predicted dienelactone hydrolase
MKYVRSQLMAFVIVWTGSSLAAAEYDPLEVEKEVDIRTIDLSVQDSSRDRGIPIRVYLPPRDPGPGSAAESSNSAPPTVLFSHGLGGSRKGSTFLGKHWAARGYVAVFLQHPGSDESVWKDTPLAQRMAVLREAASVKNWMLRVQDVPAVLDQLAKWNDEPGHELAGRLDARRVGMSGHSFGGHTTQAVSGQNFGLGGQSLTEPRIKAAIVMSPSVPERGDINVAFGKVKTPWLLMTGTHDVSTIGNQTPESRRGVFRALAAGDKFELVLDKAEHSAFTERALPGEKQQRNPNHHRVILALSTAFWDAYLRNDPAAKEWLTGDGPRRVLEDADVWERK